MHKSESVRKNKTQKILWDSEIQTNHLIPTRRPDLVIIDKKHKNCRLVDFAVLADYTEKIKENETRDKYLDLTSELKKAAEREGDGDTNCNWRTWNGLQRKGKWKSEYESRPYQLRPCQDHPEY